MNCNVTLFGSIGAILRWNTFLTSPALGANLNKFVKYKSTTLTSVPRLLPGAPKLCT